MQPASSQPLLPSRRLALVDVLRGWALLGVVIGCYTEYYYHDQPAATPGDAFSRALETLCEVVFFNKSWTLLAGLFGYGFAVVMDRYAAQQGRSPLGFFCRRMGWLLVLALLNSAFWWGDVLKDYAVLGLVLALVFYGRSTKTLLLTGGGLLLVMPFVSPLVVALLPYNAGQGAAAASPYLHSSHWLDVFRFNLLTTYYQVLLKPHFAITLRLTWLGYMLLGFAAHRLRFFERLPARLPWVKAFFGAGLLLSVAGYVGLRWATQAQAPFLQICRVEFWLIASSVLTIGAGISWLYLAGRLPAIFASLQVVGRLTLTNYMAQGVLSKVLFLNVGLGLFNTQPYWVYVALAGGVYAAQVFFSRWWLARYTYGPVEWVWRQLSYGQRLPLRRQAALPATASGQ